MFRWILLLLLFLTSCSPRLVEAEETLEPTATLSFTVTTTVTPQPSTTPTLTPTFTPTITVTASPTPTDTATPTPLPTAYGTGQINCPGSVALMYHRILDKPKDNADGLGIDSDIDSFRKVLSYLVESGYYFPTPADFSKDIKDLVCEHKYAIVTIDDSWNDPEKMGVTKVLSSLREDNTPGSAKVWFGVITRRTVPFTAENSDKVDQWTHLKEMQNLDLVYPVSHSQTHPAELLDIVDVYNPINDGVYAQIAGEVGASRVDFLRDFDGEPYFFIYPGGNVTPLVSGALFVNGYSGAFTVTPGGLNKAYPGYLPRINGGYRCDRTVTNNAECVIEKIKMYAGS